MCISPSEFDEDISAVAITTSIIIWLADSITKLFYVTHNTFFCISNMIRVLVHFLIYQIFS